MLDHAVTANQSAGIKAKGLVDSRIMSHMTCRSIITIVDTSESFNNADSTYESSVNKKHGKKQFHKP